MCLGGEEAVLKTVGPTGLAGSNPVHGAMYMVQLVSTSDCGSEDRGFESHYTPIQL